MGTVAAHAAHWKHFCSFAREQGVRDARQVSRELVASYARHLSERIRRGEMKVAYAHNLLSSVNVVLRRAARRPAPATAPGRLGGAAPDPCERAPPHYLDRKELEGLRQALMPGVPSTRRGAGRARPRADAALQGDLPCSMPARRCARPRRRGAWPSPRAPRAAAAVRRTPGDGHRRGPGRTAGGRASPGRARVTSSRPGI